MGTELPPRPIALDQGDVRSGHGPDSFMRSTVAAGETIEFCWEQSTVYRGRPVGSGCTYRWYLDPAGDIRRAVVLDDLVDRGGPGGVTGRPLSCDELDDVAREFPDDDLTAPTGYLLLARLGGPPVGCAGLRVQPQRIREITHMFAARGAARLRTRVA